MILPTVLEAYDLIRDQLPSIQRRVLWLVRETPSGVTGLDLEPHFRQSGWKRLAELRGQGLVEVRRDAEGQTISRPGRSGRHQAVHFATPEPVPLDLVRCPTCNSKVLASRIHDGQIVLL